MSSVETCVRTGVRAGLWGGSVLLRLLLVLRGRCTVAIATAADWLVGCGPGRLPVRLLRILRPEDPGGPIALLLGGRPPVRWLLGGRCVPRLRGCVRLRRGRSVLRPARRVLLLRLVRRRRIAGRVGVHPSALPACRFAVH